MKHILDYMYTTAIKHGISEKDKKILQYHLKEITKILKRNEQIPAPMVETIHSRYAYTSLDMDLIAHNMAAVEQSIKDAMIKNTIKMASNAGYIDIEHSKDSFTGKPVVTSSLMVIKEKYVYYE